MFDPLIYLGGSVKAIDRTDDAIKVGGYLVMFGTPRDGDLSKARDYFTPATDFGLDVTRKGIIRWAHCLDPQIGKRRLGIAEVKSEPDDVGLWAEGWMKVRDEYERKVADWIEARKVGWSSAALPHTVERKAAPAGANEVVSWPLGGGDFTLTLAPADPRQIGSVMEMKAWLDDDAPPVIDAAPVVGVGPCERFERRLDLRPGHVRGARQPRNRGVHDAFPVLQRKHGDPHDPRRVVLGPHARMHDAPVQLAERVVAHLHSCLHRSAQMLAIVSARTCASQRPTSTSTAGGTNTSKSHARQP